MQLVLLLLLLLLLLRMVPRLRRAAAVRGGAVRAPCARAGSGLGRGAVGRRARAGGP